MQFSISDYLRFLECPKKFESYYRESYSDFSIIHFDDTCQQLLNEYLGISESISDISLVDKDLLSNGWYQNISLVTKRLSGIVERCFVEDDGITLYFVSLHTFPSAKLKNKITCVVYLCNVLKIDIKKIRIIYFNSNYIYDGKTYIASKMFKKSKWMCNAGNDFKLFPKFQVNTQLIEMNLDRMESVITDGIVEVSNASCREACVLHQECDIYRTESFNRRILENYNKFGLPKQQLPQIQTLAVVNNQNYCDKKALKQWLSQIKYPLFFFDFEWERKILPWEKGQALFNDFVFEYSLVKIEENGQKTEKVVIINENDNRMLFEALINDFEQCGTIFAFNAKGAEIMQLKRFAELSLNSNEKIYKIIERIISIDVPLTSGMIYHLGIKGSYSLKNIAHLISFNDYASIECQTGLDAVKMYRDYLESGDEKDKKSLIDYCKADSLAMVALLKWYQDNACD